MHRIPLDDPNKLEKKYLPRDFKAKKIFTNPYILKLSNLISSEEIDELLEMCKGKFTRSNVIVDGKLVYNETRTSSTAYLFEDGLPGKYSKNIERFIKRICYLANCERNQLEIMAVRYKKGEKFDPHVDYLEDNEIGVLDNGGQRIYTFFIYLNTLHSEDGGETEFTQLGIKSKPRKGHALFWYNRNPDTGKMMPETQHSGNPVLTKKIKHGINCWVRSKAFY